MKQIISATILSLAFLLGTIFHEWANRYEYFYSKGISVTQCDKWENSCGIYKMTLDKGKLPWRTRMEWRSFVNELAGISWFMSDEERELRRFFNAPSPARQGLSAGQAGGSGKTVEDILGPRPEKEE